MPTKKRSQKTKPRVVGCIGAGNMATALVRGFIAAGLYEPGQIIVSDSDAGQRRTFSRRLKVAVTGDNLEVMRTARIIILAVKPQVLDEVVDQLGAEGAARHLIVSIAPATTARLEAHLHAGARVIRVMPNTPALLGRGMSVIVRGRNATAADEKLCLRLFRAVGAAVAVADEGQLDAVTGLSGSGPAYVYRFAEGLIRGGTDVGLPEPLARELALQTVLGAAHMLVEAGESPETLRARVTSPRGTTLAGLTEMDRRGLVETVVAGVQAATARSRELASGG